MTALPEASSRSRTFTWTDPMELLSTAAQLDGLTLLRGIASRAIPPPPAVAALGEVELVTVEPGRVVFTLEPAEHHVAPPAVPPPILTDTDTLLLRPAVAADLDAVRRFVRGLSPESIRSRFFAAGPPPEWMIRALVEDMTSVLATRGGAVVGMAGYKAYGNEAVDVAVVVSDLEQGRGLGPRLVAHAVRHARRLGARRATLSILPENRPAISIVRKLWPDARPVLDSGVYEYSVELS